MRTVIRVFCERRKPILLELFQEICDVLVAHIVNFVFGYSQTDKEQPYVVVIDRNVEFFRARGMCLLILDLQGLLQNDQKRLVVNGGQLLRIGSLLQKNLPEITNGLVFQGNGRRRKLREDVGNSGVGSDQTNSLAGLAFGTVRIGAGFQFVRIRQRIRVAVGKVRTRVKEVNLIVVGQSVLVRIFAFQRIGLIGSRNLGKCEQSAGIVNSTSR